jgi:DNA polymerase-1
MSKDDLKTKMREATKVEAKSIAKTKPAGMTPAFSPGGSAELPGVEAVSVHLTLAEQSNRVQAALAAHPDPGLVLHGGQPHRIVPRVDEEGAVRHVLQPHTRESMLGHVARRVPFVRVAKEGQRLPTDPSLKLIDDLLSLPGYPTGIPVLRHIKNTPLLTASGELIATSGLLPEYQVYLALDPALEGMTLPHNITQEDIDEACEILFEPFVDFPFADDGSSANFVALLFTLVFRELITGLTPLFAVDANRASTGKGVLLSVASILAYGCETPFSPGNVPTDELRKRLLALAAQGVRFHILDNMENMVWSPELAAFLTSTRWEDRKLGVSETPDYPNRMIIALTGNHVRVGGDIARRTVLIRLRNEHDRPEERSDFRYDPITDHVLRERPRLLRAMYTIVAAWHRGGRVVPANSPRMGSFQAWANFSAGILAIVGDPSELLANRDEVRGRDTDAEEYLLLLVRGRQHFATNPFTASELLGALDPEEVPTVVGSAKGNSLSKRLGRLLVRIQDRAFGDESLTLRDAGAANHTRRYRIETADDRAKLTKALRAQKDKA